jgi:hypothetical protein
MWDLYLGLVVIAALSWLAFRLTATAAQRWSRLQRNLLATLLVAAMVLYSRLLWQNTVLAQWLPFSNLIVIGNWFPIFLGALAGVLMETEQLPFARRLTGSTALACFASFALVLPLFGQPPKCSDQWSYGGSCQQTTPFTCSAASAATLLRMHGIEASEQEMAELCLTRHGTSWLGLYRGLKLKTAGTPWTVEIVQCAASELPQHADWPMIMEVGLEANAPIDATFRSEFGWAPGMRHSVLLTGYSAEVAHIVDPSPQFGREDWDEESLQLLWRGHGLRLVKRER